jgi:hypothetical protein
LVQLGSPVALPGFPFFVEIIIGILPVIDIVNTEVPDPLLPFFHDGVGKANFQPARFPFLVTQEIRFSLYPALSGKLIFLL